MDTPPFPSPIRIEELTEKDLSAVMDIDQECLGGLWTKAGYQREIDSPNSQILIMKLAREDASSDSHDPNATDQTHALSPPIAGEADHNLIGIGCAWFILEEAHITMLAIRPRYRRQGLGQILLITLLQNAMGRQSQWATLEVRTSNHAAQTLYGKLGFINIGQRKQYYQDTKEDALILWNKGLQKQSFHHDLEQLKQSTITRLHHNGWKIIDPMVTQTNKSS